MENRTGGMVREIICSIREERSRPLILSVRLGVVDNQSTMANIGPHTASGKFAQLDGPKRWQYGRYRGGGVSPVAYRHPQKRS